jgi:hypothetical protein
MKHCSADTRKESEDVNAAISQLSAQIAELKAMIVSDSNERRRS